MIQKEIAEMLNGVAIYEEDTNKQDMQYAKENGCVIVFGASDDLMEFRGAIDDEIDSYGGCTIMVTESGLLMNECGDERCPYFAKLSKEAKYYVTALWWEEGEYSWTYRTNIPNTKAFDVMEDGKRYCRGIAFDLKDVRE